MQAEENPMHVLDQEMKQAIAKAVLISVLLAKASIDGVAYAKQKHVERLQRKADEPLTTDDIKNQLDESVKNIMEQFGVSPESYEMFKQLFAKFNVNFDEVVEKVAVNDQIATPDTFGEKLEQWKQTSQAEPKLETTLKTKISSFFKPTQQQGYEQSLSVQDLKIFEDLKHSVKPIDLDTLQPQPEQRQEQAAKKLETLIDKRTNTKYVKTELPLAAGEKVVASDRNNFGTVKEVLPDETAKVHFYNKNTHKQETVILPQKKLTVVREPYNMELTAPQIKAKLAPARKKIAANTPNGKKLATAKPVKAPKPPQRKKAETKKKINA